MNPIKNTKNFKLNDVTFDIKDAANRKNGDVLSTARCDYYGFHPTGQIVDCRGEMDEYGEAFRCEVKFVGTVCLKDQRRHTIVIYDTIKEVTKERFLYLYQDGFNTLYERYKTVE